MMISGRLSGESITLGQEIDTLFWKMMSLLVVMEKACAQSGKDDKGCGALALTAAYKPPDGITA
jgi:hypothetical protein